MITDYAERFLMKELELIKKTQRGWVITGRDDVDNIITECAKKIVSIEWALDCIKATGGVNPKIITQLVVTHQDLV